MMCLALLTIASLASRSVKSGSQVNNIPDGPCSSRARSFEELFAEAANPPVLLLRLFGSLIDVIVLDEGVYPCLCFRGLYAEVFAPTDPFE